MILQGNPCTVWLGDIAFPLDPRYARFVGQVGIDDQAKGAAEIPVRSTAARRLEGRDQSVRCQRVA